MQVTLSQNHNKWAIWNARLSCAVGTRDRIEQFQNILSHISPKAIPIICGDLNIPDSALFQRLTGWIRGFTKKDYLLNERREFERIFADHHFINLFHGTSTSIFDRPLLQFDHILVPDTVIVERRMMSDDRFGSDHRMLLADIRFPTQ